MSRLQSWIKFIFYRCDGKQDCTIDLKNVEFDGKCDDHKHYARIRYKCKGTFDIQKRNDYIDLI